MGDNGGGGGGGGVIGEWVGNPSKAKEKKKLGGGRGENKVRKKKN